MANIEINGKALQVADGAMVIEAADAAGITIPRFCYHKKLSVAANCRMCLVEVEKVAKPVPACATPVTDGMKIHTKSTMALEAQKSVMEFLLINHPLDCPICDQGGECELQDIAVGFGQDISRYTEQKRVVADKNIGPLIATEMTRCIHCTRCVRFGQEVAGIMELGATGRGENMRIGTYVERAVASEMSGNVIDLCPVGALTSKPYRYTGRPWENKQTKSIAAHDCLGSNIVIETRRDKVMRVLPDENEAINESWLSDRDRFSYLGLKHSDRLTAPMIKQGNNWKEVDWQTALNYAFEGLKTVIKKDGAENIGALVSPSATVEEMYLAQKLMRGIGSNSIDHRLRQSDFSDQDIAPQFPALGQSLTELENNNAVLLVGSWIRKDQPIAAHRIRKAALKGAAIMAVNAVDYDFNFPLAEKIITSPAQMVNSLAAIAKALLTLTGKPAPAGLESLLTNVAANDASLDIAKHLHNADKATVILGSQAMLQPQLAELRALSHLIADLSSATMSYLSNGANTAGACLTGVLPHRLGGGKAAEEKGKNVKEMLSSGMNAFVLLDVEPEYDIANPSAALKAVHEADFVISMTAYVTDEMKDYADVLLPVSPASETSGTLVNAEGIWQSFTGSVTPLAETRPAWKVLRVLGNIFELDGFDYITSEDVRDEAKQQAGETDTSNKIEWRCPKSLAKQTDTISCISLLPMYAIDCVVRRSDALQNTNDALQACVIINESLAKQHKIEDQDNIVVTQDDVKLILRVYLDDAVPDNCAIIPQGVAGVETLGAAYSDITLSTKS
ncbi:MAG: NADH-quinone oxidoreductase subunit NuoG [Gammaproteobacteria bacterium]|nr:NADH-quinone oxidoreductase subunit NuoG [Gammaproteobacteria bacterium]